MNQQDSPEKAELRKQCRQIIHDVRTQLFCIEISGKSLQIHMPELLDAYQAAVRSGEKDASIPPEHLEVLYDSGNEIQQQLSDINTTLDKLLELFKTNNSRARSERLNSIQGDEPDGSLSQMRLKILLVEDEEIHQDISCKVLNSLDCSVEIAIDGLKAMDKLRTGSFDLVLMDLNMPHMDGMSTAREIRNLDCQHRTVPIIGLSNIEPHDSDAFFAAGFNTFLLKPLKRDTFTDIIAQLDAHGKS